MKTTAVVMFSSKTAIGQALATYTPKILAPTLFKSITAPPVKVIATELAIKNAATNIIAAGSAKSGFINFFFSVFKFHTLVAIGLYIYQWIKQKLLQALKLSINYFPFISFWILSKKAYKYRFKMFNPYRLRRILLISYVWSLGFIPLYAIYRVACSQYFLKELYKNKAKPELQ